MSYRHLNVLAACSVHIVRQSLVFNLLADLVKVNFDAVDAVLYHLLDSLKASIRQDFIDNIGEHDDAK